MASRADLGFPFAASRAAWIVSWAAWVDPEGETTGDFVELEEVEEEREVWRRRESTDAEEVEVFVRWRGSLGISVLL
jgi:hypothetical protein